MEPPSRPSPWRRGLVACLILAAIGAGCGGSGGPDDNSRQGEHRLHAGTTADLEVVVDLSLDRRVRFDARCDRAGEGRACRALERIRAVAAVDRSKQTCSGVYGGPQIARISGTIGGEFVSVTLSRENGCRISEWRRVLTALGRTDLASPG